MPYVTQLILTSKNPAKLSTDVLVLALAGDGDSARVLGATDLSAAARKALDATVKLLSISADAGTVTRIPAVEGIKAASLALTGVGDLAQGAEPTSEQLRRAAGSAVRELTGVSGLALALPAPDAAAVGAITEGAALGGYQFTEYKASKSAPAESVEVLSAVAKQREVKDAFTRAQVVATAVNGARSLVNSSPNHLYPESFAQIARNAVKGTKVSIDVLDTKALKAGGYGGLVGVGQGSTRGPQLVQLTYKPSRAKAHYALVGKGITFDSGGLSLKPAKGMETMKLDMAGAAAVLHTVLAAAELQLPVAVTGWLALAENLPSGTAQRPSDVITIRGGKTVEVLNTDAEGRLVLADALVAAGEQNPDVILDIATLTGAQMVALGNQVSAVMGTDEVREDVVAAAQTSGEDFWPMPLPAELVPSMKSQVADIANIGERFGGMLVGGLFLKEFVGDTPWAHLDIAGPAFNDSSPRHYVPKGGTGVGVRTMLAMLERATQA